MRDPTKREEVDIPTELRRFCSMANSNDEEMENLLVTILEKDLKEQAYWTESVDRLEACKMLLRMRLREHNVHPIDRYALLYSNESEEYDKRRAGKDRFNVVK